MMPIADDLRKIVQEWAQRVVVEATAIVEQETWAAEPERSGAMRQKTQALPVDLTGPVYASQITADTDYAGYTDAGTRGPYVIPRGGAGPKILMWEGADGPVFRRSVMHPGITGTQWFNGGVDGGEPMRSRWTVALEQAIGRQ